VGPIDAAVGMARALAEVEPDAVVLVGTCGAFGRAVIGEIVVSEAFEAEGARPVIAVNPRELAHRAIRMSTKGPSPA
jgi:hypothetical protein